MSMQDCYLIGVEKIICLAEVFITYVIVRPAVGTIEGITRKSSKTSFTFRMIYSHISYRNGSGWLLPTGEYRTTNRNPCGNIRFMYIKTHKT